MNVEYPDAQVAAVQSAVLESLHSVHVPVSTDTSEAKSLQQNPASMNVEYPGVQVPVVHSVKPDPMHSEQVCTDVS